MKVKQKKTEKSISWLFIFWLCMKNIFENKWLLKHTQINQHFYSGVHVFMSAFLHITMNTSTPHYPIFTADAKNWQTNNRYDCIMIPSSEYFARPRPARCTLVIFWGSTISWALHIDCSYRKFCLGELTFTTKYTNDHYLTYMVVFALLPSL